MSVYRDRAHALKALVAMPAELFEVLQALRSMPPLPPSEPVPRLTRDDIRRILEGFASGDLPAELVERWAEAVHSADDVELDPPDQEFLSEALFELSTPTLFGSMNDIVIELRDRDRRSTRNS